MKGKIFMYTNLEELPATFGVADLANILNISRNKAYDIIKDDNFPKYYIGRKIIISKKHFLLWMDKKFSNQ